MGASVVAYWPELTDEQAHSMPGFRNDDRAWGNWMAEREDNAPVLDAVKRLKAEAILTVKTDGWEDDDVNWVTPDELREAAERLRVAVQTASPEAATVLCSYRQNANLADPVEDEFIRDLEDIIGLAEWAQSLGASRMTLEVNW